MPTSSRQDVSKHADITELRKRAAKFRTLLLRTKAQIGTAQFEWYPYDTLSAFDHLDRLLTGRHRLLLELAEDQPILDLGCQDGDLSFYFESLGCEVHAVDLPDWNYNQMRGVARLREALQSRIQVHQVDLDTQFRLPNHTFGLALFFGVLYHLKNPFQALEILASRVRYCLLSTRIAQVTPGPGIRIQDQPLAYLLSPGETNNDKTNYWIFSEEGLRRLIQRSGWQLCEFMTIGCTRDSDPVSGDRDERAFCLLRSTAGGDGRMELLSGWHRLEHDCYRWTERRFSVRLKAPAPELAAKLRLRFYIPPNTLDTLGPITLSAEVNGVSLSPRTYASAEEQVYSADVPAAALTGTRALVEFALDKAVPPSAEDNRELGVVVRFSADADPPALLVQP
ncbi:MAG: methyltransferase domain-containing protein [Bryobacteraceae bacterium]|jgi:SAM-dependent methyltransferase